MTSHLIVTSERKEKLGRFLNESVPECKTDWEDVKLFLQEAADHTFGRKKVVLNDWFDDQDEENKYKSCSKTRS